MLEYMLPFEIAALVTTAFFGYFRLLRKKNANQEG